ncbi:MAG: EAL domain-containing protein [Oscillospiraceae bacterium]|nr:EAL domain-containing protein [Oscillospiraceae bacterium]
MCRDIRRWLDEGKNAVRVSVNLSRKHLMDIDLLKTLLGIIDRNGVPHEYIEIELTETTSYVEFDNLKRIVSGLQQAGVYTSVDDFGIGYSSLNLIREIPWNVLKVDRCFLPGDDEKGSVTDLMFRHVVTMALDIGLECIAEGVETPAQIDVLRNYKCRVAQGFFFDRPLPVNEFEKKLDGFCYEI